MNSNTDDTTDNEIAGAVFELLTPVFNVTQGILYPFISLSKGDKVLILKNSIVSSELLGQKEEYEFLVLTGGYKGKVSCMTHNWIFDCCFQKVKHE